MNNFLLDIARSRRLLLAASSLLSLLLVPAIAAAAGDPVAPFVSINTSADPDVSNNEVFAALKMAMLVSSIVMIPAVLMTVTCFPRIAIVLSMARQALGTAQTPPNQVIIGLSLFLTFAIMGDTFQRVFDESVVPYSENQIGHMEAFNKAYGPLRDFMLPHTREQDLALFIDITNSELPASPEQLSATIVVPAFILSELNTAFQIAFLIYIPFLILDMVISSVLTSMSMITLPPTVISLPLKLMLFVVIDGWSLIIGNLVKTYSV
jgi:flagellar biosynthetic protein FliP